MSASATRRLIFAGLAIAVALALIFPARPNIKISDGTRKVYEYMDALPAGSRALVSFDFESSAFPEILPANEALISHLFERRIKIIAMSLQAEGASLGEAQLRRLAKKYGASDGEDYVFLGFQVQQTAAILGMGESFAQMFPRDYYGRPYDSLGILNGVKTFEDVACVVSVSDGSGPINWAEYGRARHGIDVLGLVSAVMVTGIDPYVSSGQVVGIVGGLRGAAEYEALLGAGAGAGARGLMAQSVSHIYLVIIILIGNVVYWKTRRAGKQK